MRITTERLVLSRISGDDADDLVAMLLNPALYTYIGDAPASKDEAGARVARWLGGSPDPDLLWINYVARADGRLVGLAQATVSRAGGSHWGTCELAYLVDPPAQRRGYATEMMAAFLADLRETLHPTEFTADICPGHTASEGVARALGLVPTDDFVAGERVWRAS